MSDLIQQANRIGINQIKRWLPGGKQVGNEWVVKNPTRVDGTPGSFKVNTVTGRWSDFATNDSGGDPVSLYAYIHDCGQGEAARRIIDAAGGVIDSAPQHSAGQAPAATDPVPIFPVPADAPRPIFRHPEFGHAVRTWEYKDADGNTLYHVARYEDSAGKKYIMPHCYCQVGSLRQWKMKHPPEPRPLFGLDMLSADPFSTVLVVEGEKCKEIAAEVLSKYVVISWSGGGKSVKKADWTPLKGRNVVIWPDNDAPGMEAAAEIRGLIAKSAASVKVAMPPQDRPEGWDVGDAIQREGWTEQDIEHMLDDTPKRKSSYPFIPLGSDHGTYYFMSARSQQVIPIPMAQMGKKGLMMLAPLAFWQTEFPNKNGVNWDVAADTVMSLCDEQKTYDPNRVRGRGVWFDGGRVVLHLGDRLLSGGRVADLMAMDSNYIYEQRPSIAMPSTSAATEFEAAALLRVTEALPLEREADALMLAGWCALAPICGALSWRPHLWITGPAGSGKSTVLEKIIRPMLGHNAVYALGASSEAGVRQKLQNDALPVVIDEAESEDMKQQEMLQGILTLMRQSSSDSGASILKGTTTGKNLQFAIRSCFAFASIGVGVHRHADESRTTVIMLRKDDAEGSADRYAHLLELIREYMTDEFTSKIRARMLHMVPVVRQNAVTFAAAVASVMGNNQRAGDQVGALLAGAYALMSDEVISLEQARQVVSKLDFNAKTVGGCDSTDEEKCLQTIIQHQIKAPAAGGNVVDASIGELIAVVAGLRPEELRFNTEEIHTTLKRHGIRLMENGLLVGYNHTEIKKILRNTPWAHNYSLIIRRLPHAKPHDKVRFGPGVNMRATRLELKEFME